MTMGTICSDEVKIAKDVADALNCKSYLIETKPNMFLKNAEKYIKKTGGLDIFVQSAAYEVLKLLRQKISKIMY